MAGLLRLAAGVRSAARGWLRSGRALSSMAVPVCAVHDMHGAATGARGNSFSHIARRETLEDRIIYARHAASGADIYGIFDGHGGTFVADFLANVLMSELRDSTVLTPDTLVQSFASVNRRLNSRLLVSKDPFMSRVGSTALVAVVSASDILIASVGDSRAVLCHNGECHQLTMDHRPQRADEARRIKAAGGSISWVGTPRVSGRLSMTRAFGALDLQEKGVTARPEIVRHTILPRDHCLVMGTDGLFDAVTNTVVGQVVMGAASSQVAADHLVEEALSRGARDNLSGFVIPLPGWDLRPQLAVDVPAWARDERHH